MLSSAAHHEVIWGGIGPGIFALAQNRCGWSASDLGHFISSELPIEHSLGLPRFGQNILEKRKIFCPLTRNQDNVCFDNLVMNGIIDCNCCNELTCCCHLNNLISSEQ
jgi:hypothetical protein